MKPRYLLLITALIPLFSFSQTLLLDHKATPRVFTAGQANVNQTIKGQQRHKVFGDTIFYEDFDSLSVANNWTIVDLSNNNTPWIWAPGNTAPGGQYTSVPPLASTTASNGYMLLPADRYNTPTPLPPQGWKDMDTYIQVGPIDLRNSSGNPRDVVFAKWQQTLSWCCAFFKEMVVETSLDGINWSTPIDATAGINGVTIWPNGVSNSIDLSPQLKGQDSAYLRFRSTFHSHFFWMIDDLLLYEGPLNNLELLTTAVNFHPAYRLVPQYFEVPAQNLSPILFEGLVVNQGGNVATGVMFEVDVIGDSAIGGGPGAGLVFTDSEPVRPGFLQPLAVDTGFTFTGFSNFSAQHYTINYRVTSDSLNQRPSSAIDSKQLSITNDSIIALERGKDYFNGITGPGDFPASAGTGDALAALVIVEDTVASKGIRFWVDSSATADIANIQISPIIWKFEEDSVFNNGVITEPFDSAIQGIVCQSPISFTIDTCNSSCPTGVNSILNTWIDLQFSSSCILNPGTYYFGFEQTGGSNKIMAARDSGAEKRATQWSNMMYLAGNNGLPPAWYQGGFVTGLRLIVDYNALITSAETENRNQVSSDFKVYPNPADGLFTIEVLTNSKETFILNVSNMLGQNVVSEAINVNGDVRRDIDLTSFEKGVYFVSVEDGSQKLVKKVVLR